MATRGGRSIQLILSFVLLAIAAWIFLNHQFMLDRIAVWNYQPSQDIRALAERATMQDDGEFYFYASRPELADQSAFNEHCGNQEEHAVILGCYVGQRIYVYNVEDERLDGVREVTAAHEMLHAAYERLPGDEQQRLGALLEAELDRASPELLERLKVYDSLPDADRTNELHSIIGTEVADIDANLEEHYRRYFADRQTVVALFHQYESVFRDLREQQKILITELNALAEEINSRTQAYNEAITLLNGDIQAFNARANTPGGFASQAEFNQARDNLLAQQTALENEYVAIEAQREVYNQKKAELDALNVQHESLQRSLDSTPEPVPSV